MSQSQRLGIDVFYLIFSERRQMRRTGQSANQNNYIPFYKEAKHNTFLQHTIKRRKNLILFSNF